MLDLDQPVHMYLDVSIVCPTDEGMVNLGHFQFFEGLLGLFIRNLLDLEEGFLNAFSGANHSDGTIGGILGLGDGDLGGCKALQLLKFRASLAEEEPVVLLRDLDGGVGLGLEVHQDHPLGLQHVRLLAGDQEGEASVLGAAHLDFASTGRLDAGQLLVGIADAEALDVHSLPLLGGDVENLHQEQIMFHLTTKGNISRIGQDTPNPSYFQI